MAEDLRALQQEVLAQVRARLEAERLAAQQATQARAGWEVEKPAMQPTAEGRGEPLPHWAVDSVKGFGSGLAQGVIGLPGVPGDLQRLALLGENWARSKLRLNPADPKNRYFLPTSGELIHGAESYLGLGPFYRARTMPGRFFQTAGEYGSGALLPGGQFASLTKFGGNALRSVVAPAVAAQAAYELAPEPKRDLVKALTGFTVGHLATKPYGVNARVDEVLATQITPDTVKNFRANGPKGALLESNDNFARWGNHIALQQDGGSKDLLRTLTQRQKEMPDHVVRQPVNTMHDAMNVVENAAKMRATYDQIRYLATLPLPPKAQNLKQHKIRNDFLPEVAVGALTGYLEDDVSKGILAAVLASGAKNLATKSLQSGWNNSYNRVMASRLGLQDGAAINGPLRVYIRKRAPLPDAVTVPARGILTTSDWRAQQNNNE